MKPHPKNYYIRVNRETFLLIKKIGREERRKIGATVAVMADLYEEWRNRMELAIDGRKD